MYRDKKVTDVMVPISEYPVIHKDTNVAQAFGVMREFFHQKEGTWYGFQSVLVVNNKDELVGLLTLRSLLKAFKLRSMLEHLLKSDPAGLFFMPGLCNSLDICAKDIMRPLNLITVQGQSDIFEAILVMVKKKINTLPVFDGNELVGIVRTIDLFWTVGEFLD